MLIEDIFKALADTTRLRIARLLGTMELAVGEIAQVLQQSQPRVSRHLKLLLEAGLVERRREGAWAFFKAPEKGAAAALARAGAARRSWFPRRCRRRSRAMVRCRGGE